MKPSTDWETPQDLFDALDKEFKFDLDVCANIQNYKVRNYINKNRDALKAPWPGVCWMNPPYNNQISRWIHKAFNESQRGNLVVCLLQSRTSDTAAWHDYISKASEIRFIKGRLSFGLNGKFSRSNISNIIVVFGPYCKGPPIISSIGINGKSLKQGVKTMENGLMKLPEASGVVAIEQQRAVQEVQASMIIAKKFARDPHESFVKIMKACERIGLAEGATYSYPRGDATVTGPSIRLAEVLAQSWGNLSFGIRELSQSVTAAGGISEVEAFCWDLETNTRQIKTFKVPHVRFSRAKGFVSLKDPRDIYEMVANQGARRLRACILGIIPGDIIESAVKKCEETIEKGDDKPFEDRVREMLIKFDALGVSKQMIEKKLGHKIKDMVPTDIVPLQKIYNSLKDGMSARGDWFDIPEGDISKDTKKLTKDIKKTTPPVKEQIEQKSDEVKTLNGIEAEFRRRWISKKKGFPEFVANNLEEFKNASAKIKTEAERKWNRLIELGTIPKAAWPSLLSKDQEQEQEPGPGPESEIDWSHYDVIKEDGRFVNFKEAVENLGVEVYQKALEQLGIRAPESPDDCANVAHQMSIIADEDIQF